jgi:response regulator of citrate/malate metabolism
MGLFDLLERAINEHGSAMILRERLALAREQHDAVVRDLQAERDKYEAEAKRLTEQLGDAEAKARRLQQQLETLTTTSGLAEEETSILKLLANTQRHLTALEVARHLAASLNRVKYFLTELEKREFVGATHYYTGQASEYALAHKGREFLIHNNLIE